MKISIRDIFRKGELWSNLEETIASIRKSLNHHSKCIEKSKNNEILLAHYIKQLKKDNSELKTRIEQLENRMWDLKVVSNSKDTIIVKDPFEKSKRLELEDRPNKS